MELPDLLRTLLVAMTPVGELRASIPLAIWRLELPWYQALPVSLIGNILPVLVLVPGLERMAQLLQRFPNPAGRLLEWRAERLHRSHGWRFHRHGSLALITLVAIPLPLTGAWTGSLAAWAFHVPARTAIPLIGVGVLIAGITVTLLTLAGLHIGLLVAE